MTMVNIEIVTADEYITSVIADFTGPSIEEFFDENPCLLEIGPLSLAKLTYGNWLETIKDVQEMNSEDAVEYEKILAARLEVADNFMKFFNIKHKR